jgi:uncharacterized membrane protein
MAGLAYLFLPVSGLIAYFNGASGRMRFHGLQAVLIGCLWPLSLIICSKVSPGATQVAFVVGALVWLALMVPAFFGADPRLPGIGKLLRSAAENDPSAEVPL